MKLSEEDFKSVVQFSKRILRLIAYRYMVYIILHHIVAMLVREMQNTDTIVDQKK